MLLDASEQVFRTLCEVTPGGVNSPFRGFQHVALEGRDLKAVVMASGHGAYMRDVDGNEYVDYVCAWGPLILGHNHPRIREAAVRAVQDGWVLGASTPYEADMARAVRDAMPSMEQVRFVNSGAEAVQACVRLARAFTGRSFIIKLEGGYHGHVESLDMADPLDRPQAKPSGVVPALLDHTLVVPFNDAPALASLLEARGSDVAAVIVEPVAGSMGVIAPREGYLQEVRRLAHQHGALFVLDEVLTGFRVARGGAQERYGVQADLTALGKILGGGFPAGGYGGRRDIMAHVAPLGAMYQAGTFCGNPVTMRAGLETLRVLAEPGVYEQLESRTHLLEERLLDAARQSGVCLQMPRVGSMFSFFFQEGPVHDLKDFAERSDARFARFFHAMLERGHYFPPSQSDAAVVSLAHTDEDILRTAEAAADVFASWRRQGLEPLP